MQSITRLRNLPPCRRASTISCQQCGESDVVPVKVAIGAETFWTIVKMDQVLVEHEPIRNWELEGAPSRQQVRVKLECRQCKRHSWLTVQFRQEPREDGSEPWPRAELLLSSDQEETR